MGKRAPDASAERRPMPAWRVIPLIVLGLALIAGAWWHARQRAGLTVATARIQQVLDTFRQGLPREFAPGLVFEWVDFEGSDLVMTIRSTRRSAADPGPELEQVRLAERVQMLQLCQSDDVLYLLAQGIGIRRRFIDSEDRVFFEVRLAPSDCAR